MNPAALGTPINDLARMSMRIADRLTRNAASAGFGV